MCVCVCVTPCSLTVGTGPSEGFGGLQSRYGLMQYEKVLMSSPNTFEVASLSIFALRASNKGDERLSCESQTGKIDHPDANQSVVSRPCYSENALLQSRCCSVGERSGYCEMNSPKLHTQTSINTGLCFEHEGRLEPLRSAAERGVGPKTGPRSAPGAATASVRKCS